MYNKYRGIIINNQNSIGPRGSPCQTASSFEYQVISSIIIIIIHNKNHSGLAFVKQYSDFRGHQYVIEMRIMKLEAEYNTLRSRHSAYFRIRS